MVFLPLHMENCNRFSTIFDKMQNIIEEFDNLKDI